jgi:MFS family permease
VKALAVATAGYGLVLLDVTIVNVALPAISDDLGASRAALQWVVDGYALALACLMLSAGHLADRAGRRRVFAGGLALFGLASAACALAPSPGALVAARVVQGIGAAALLPASLALVTAAHGEPGARARAIGTWAGLGSLGLVAGPLLGGLLTGWLGWRAVFWVGVPVCCAALLGLRGVAESRAPVTRSRPDVAGQLAAVAGLALLVGGLIEARRLGWGSPPVLAAPLGSAVALGALVVAERRAAHPMLDMRFFRDRGLSARRARVRDAGRRGGRDLHRAGRARRDGGGRQQHRAASGRRGRRRADRRRGGRGRVRAERGRAGRRRARLCGVPARLTRDQRALHARLAVPGDRAVELVLARLEVQLQLGL